MPCLQVRSVFPSLSLPLLNWRPFRLEVAKASPGETRAEPRTFPKGASWDELRAHCVRAHPEACVDVARLHPAEIFELRRRLSM